MTTQKAQRKIKTSTVAITVLSILLAIAVVSTIVLAAFTANRTATTTITFGGGLQIQVGGAVTGDTTMSSTGAITIQTDPSYSTNVTIDEITVNPSETAHVAFGMNAVVGGAGFDISEGTANQSARTVTWNILDTTNENAVIGTIVVTAGENFTLATVTGGSNLQFVAYQNSVAKNDVTPATMIESITVTATDSVNDLAGLSITSLITGIGASTTDGTNLDAVKAFNSGVTQVTDVE